jgi:hypothetical protein
LFAESVAGVSEPVAGVPVQEADAASTSNREAIALARALDIDIRLSASRPMVAHVHHGKVGVTKPVPVITPMLAGARAPTVARARVCSAIRSRREAGDRRATVPHRSPNLEMRACGANRVGRESPGRVRDSRSWTVVLCRWVRWRGRLAVRRWSGIRPMTLRVPEAAHPVDASTTIGAGEAELF